MILVLGGTTEGRELAQDLSENGFSCILSVATDLGGKMVCNIGAELHTGKLDPAGLKELIGKQGIRLIIDATHPYAVEIKKIAREVAGELRIIYSRYERERTLLPDNPDVIVVNDYQTALETLKNSQGGILFTIGIKHLHLFKSLWNEPLRPVWVKIYPELESIMVCQELGLLSKQIFAFHGAGNRDILKAMITMTGVSWIVTKESGTIGGTDVKVAVGLELGKRVLIIKRPEPQPGLSFHNHREVLEFAANFTRPKE